MNAHDEDKAVLELAAILDLNAAQPLHERLLSLRGKDVAVDATLVERVGGQCLQVLLSARRSWERDKAGFTITGASDAFVNALRQMGFASDLTPAKEASL